MSTYTQVNDAIIGERIYCTFENSTGKGVISKGSRTKDRGQYQTIGGNPATAVIRKKLRRIK